MNKKTLIIPLIIITIIIIVGFVRSGRTFRKTTLLMGTVVRITLNGVSEKQASKLFEEVLEEASRIEHRFSTTIADSEVSRINKEAAGDWEKLSEEGFNLLSTAGTINEETGGAFDITVKPLITVWANAAKKGVVPSQEEINSVLPLIGFSNAVIDRKSKSIRFIRKGVKIDLGGIAKGYAVDRMGAILSRQGCNNFIIEAGGDILVSGGGAGGRAWKLGLQHPRENAELLGTFSLKNSAVATSGDYERFYIHEGKRYHHILDPRTGYPSENAVSATVIAPTAMEADAYATAFMVMDTDEVERFIAKRNNLEAILVTEENGELTIKDFLKKTVFEKRKTKH